MPFKDDKPKDAKNSPFEASSVLVVKAMGRIETSLVPPWKSNRDEIILNNKIAKTNVINELVSIALSTLSRQLQRFAHAP